MPKQAAKKTTRKKTKKKVTLETKNSSVKPAQREAPKPKNIPDFKSLEFPDEEVGTRFEGQKPENILPDFEEVPVPTKPVKAAPVRDPLPPFGEGPRQPKPHPVTAKEKKARKHALREQENFWIQAVIDQNTKTTKRILWLGAQREYQNRRAGPVPNWSPKIAARVQKKFLELVEDFDFLRPVVRFHLQVFNSPQQMTMALLANHMATFEALRKVLEDHSEEI